MILTDITDQQLLEILAWPEDYREAHVNAALEVFQKRRLNKTKSKKLVQAFLHEKVSDMLSGVKRLDEVERIPESRLFTRKEIETCIRKILKARQDKSEFLRKHSNGGNYLNGAF